MIPVVTPVVAPATAVVAVVPGFDPTPVVLAGSVPGLEPTVAVVEPGALVVEDGVPKGLNCNVYYPVVAPGCDWV